jgi:CubicO group peptidase (beta-lactamase class C family)
MARSFQQLRDVFAAQLEEHGGGARIAVYQHGQLVVDLHGGWTDKRHTTPVTEDTLFMCASCTKAVASVCVARLVEQGLLEYSAPVSRYWPEFGQNGKQDIRVVDLLNHRGGLPVFAEERAYPLRLLEAVHETASPAWTEWCDFLARQPSPYKGQQAYHAVTLGFYLSVLVSRVAGRRLSVYYDEEIRTPFAVDYFMGQPVDPARLSRVLEGHETVAQRPPSQLFMAATGPLGGDMGSFFKIRNSESPSHIGWGHGQSLAWLFQLVLQGRILSAATLEAMTTPAFAPAHDLVLDQEIGFLRGGLSLLDHLVGPSRAPHVFGHAGLGGQLVFADTRLGLSVGYSTNAHLSESSPIRLRQLIEAIYAELDAPRPSKL